MPDNTSEAKKKILIVESKVLINGELKSRIQALGYVLCRKAATVEKALELVERLQPDLVLMDISLKGKLEKQNLADIIHDKWGVPTIFISRYMDPDSLEQRLGFETLLSDLSSDFVNQAPENVNAAISSWMERLCLFLEVDRGGVHQFSQDNRDLIATHQYAIPGIEESPKHTTSEFLPWFTRQVLNGEIIKLDDSRSALPPEAEAERRFIREQGTKSVISIPLKIGDRVLGAVVFGNLRFHKTWSDDLVQRIKIVGEVFANALIRKRFEEALRESRERFKRAFEHAALGIIVFNPQGRFLEVNSFFCRLLGYTETELLSMQLEDVTHPADREITHKRINQALAGDIQFIWLEKRYLHREGDEIWAYISSSLVRNPDGSPLYFVSYVQDISEIKKSRELLKEANTALKVVMDHRTRDQVDSEKNILATLEKLAFPYLEKLEATPLDHEQRAYIELLRGNLTEIVSPFASRLSDLKNKLTPTEIQVADLIKRGSTSKEIADLLRMSESAVFFHRNNIRQKLGLRHEKTNLRSFLMDLH